MAGNKRNAWIDWEKAVRREIARRADRDRRFPQGKGMSTVARAAASATMEGAFRETPRRAMPTSEDPYTPEENAARWKEISGTGAGPQVLNRGVLGFNPNAQLDRTQIRDIRPMAGSRASTALDRRNQMKALQYRLYDEMRARKGLPTSDIEMGA